MTVKLGLTDLANGQANYLNANASFALLDQLVHQRVVDKDLAAPPGSPANGAAYIVAASATGAWAGKSGQIAYWLTSVAAWTFVVPAEGWMAWVTDEAARYEYKSSAWSIFSSGGGDGGAVATVSSSSGVLDLSGNDESTFKVTLTENITSITYQSGASGARKDLIIRFKQDATGGRTVDLSGITWSGTAPTVGAAANAVTYITAVNVDSEGWEGFS